ncbi:MAG: hypothetical protein Q8L48_14130 [Archangium sp.]|nr:hypothetical protein [Archangium sp.]
MKTHGFVGGRDVLALAALAASVVLALRLGGGWPLIAGSVVLGLGVYVATWVAGRRVHVELGCLVALLEVALVLGGGHFLHAALLSGGFEAARARWLTLGGTVGPLVLAALVVARLDRTPGDG